MMAYLMGVLCAAFLCAIVNSLGTAGKGPGKLICGIFLALSLLHPLGSLELPALCADPYVKEAEDVIRSGTEQARHARNAVISDSLEAYILTKAAELGLTVEARIELKEDGTPAAVTISGPASPSEREALTGIVTAGLGLGKEELVWKGSYQSSE